MSRSVLITGSNRGIGLGLAGKFAAQGWHVYAASRNPDGARELWELERDFGESIELLEVDVANDASCAAVAEKLQGRALDLLVNNAGVYPRDGGPVAELSLDGMRQGFEVNVLGPLRMVKACLPALQRSSKPGIAQITSKMGSISDNGSGGSYAYRVSKSALNMMNRSMANDLQQVSCVVYHPGWVQTDMGGPNALIDVQKCVDGLYEQMALQDGKHSGRFFDYAGKEIPW